MRHSVVPARIQVYRMGGAHCAAASNKAAFLGASFLAGGCQALLHPALCMGNPMVGWGQTVCDPPLDLQLSMATFRLMCRSCI